MDTSPMMLAPEIGEKEYSCPEVLPSPSRLWAARHLAREKVRDSRQSRGEWGGASPVVVTRAKVSATRSRRWFEGRAIPILANVFA